MIKPNIFLKPTNEDEHQLNFNQEVCTALSCRFTLFFICEAFLTVVGGIKIKNYSSLSVTAAFLNAANEANRRIFCGINWRRLQNGLCAVS